MTLDFQINICERFNHNPPPGIYCLATRKGCHPQSKQCRHRSHAGICHVADSDPFLRNYGDLSIPARDIPPPRYPIREWDHRRQPHGGSGAIIYIYFELKCRFREGTRRLSSHEVFLHRVQQDHNDSFPYLGRRRTRNPDEDWVPLPMASLE